MKLTPEPLKLENLPKLDLLKSVHQISGGRRLYKFDLKNPAANTNRSDSKGPATVTSATDLDGEERQPKETA